MRYKSEPRFKDSLLTAMLYRADKDSERVAWIQPFFDFMYHGSQTPTKIYLKRYLNVVDCYNTLGNRFVVLLQQASDVLVN